MPNSLYHIIKLVTDETLIQVHVNKQVLSQKPIQRYLKFPLTPSLSPVRLCRNRGNSEKCYAELVSASDRINKLRDPETSSG
jgi:hypothetical protein